MDEKIYEELAQEMIKKEDETHRLYYHYLMFKFKSGFDKATCSPMIERLFKLIPGARYEVGDYFKTKRDNKGEWDEYKNKFIFRNQYYISDNELSEEEFWLVYVFDLVSPSYKLISNVFNMFKMFVNDMDIWFSFNSETSSYTKEHIETAELFESFGIKSKKFYDEKEKSIVRKITYSDCLAKTADKIASFIGGENTKFLDIQNVPTTVNLPNHYSCNIYQDLIIYDVVVADYINRQLTLLNAKSDVKTKFVRIYYNEESLIFVAHTTDEDKTYQFIFFQIYNGSYINNDLKMKMKLTSIFGQEAAENIRLQIKEQIENGK